MMMKKGIESLLEFLWADSNACSIYFFSISKKKSKKLPKPFFLILGVFFLNKHNKIALLMDFKILFNSTVNFIG